MFANSLRQVSILSLHCICTYTYYLYIVYVYISKKAHLLNLSQMRE